MKLVDKWKKKSEQLKMFAPLQLWFMQVAMLISLILNALAVIVFFLLMVMKDEFWGILAFSFGMSTYFSYKLLKSFGLPSMGIRRATELFFIPQVKQYMKNKEAKK